MYPNQTSAVTAPQGGQSSSVDPNVLPVAGGTPGGPAIKVEVFGPEGTAFRVRITPTTPTKLVTLTTDSSESKLEVIPVAAGTYTVAIWNPPPQNDPPDPPTVKQPVWTFSVTVPA